MHGPVIRERQQSPTRCAEPSTQVLVLSVHEDAFVEAVDAVQRLDSEQGRGRTEGLDPTGSLGGSVDMVGEGRGSANETLYEPDPQERAGVDQSPARDAMAR